MPKSPPLPPPTPPKDDRLLPSPPAPTAKRKSPSFSGLIRPVSQLSSDDKTPSSEGSSSTERDGAKLSVRVKELFGKDKTKRMPSPAPEPSTGDPSGSGNTGNVVHQSDSKSPSTTVSPPTTDPGVALSPPINALQITLADSDAALFRSASSTGQSGPLIDSAAVITSTSTDQFKRAVQAADKAVSRLQTASVWLGFAAQGLSAAGIWLPMVGNGVRAVVTMLEMAKEIGVAKVAALRLVERCADILSAVLAKLKSLDGLVSLDMRQDINRLLTIVHNTAFLLTKLANRPFFKLWLHAGEVQDQIAEATADVDIFFNIFHVEAAMQTNALLEQARLDREADRMILRGMIQEGLKDETVLLNMLIKKSDEQQEAIKTLQRALDNLRFEQALGPSRIHSPSGSPDMRPSIQRLVDRPADLAIGLPAPALLWATDISSQSSTRRSTTSSFASEHTDCSRLSIQAEKGISSSESSSGADWVPMAPPIDVSRGASPFRTVTRTTQQVDQRGWHPSIEDTDPRRQFIEKALDVLRRQSASSDYGVPDWTITSLEVTHEIRLATSFFSTIWRGRWQGEQVAIKELHRNIDRSLFISEVEVWRRLRSKHVLPFFGASSTTGPPPWFMVSPFMHNGNILTYLRNSKWTSKERRTQTLSLIYEVAQGMEYLHARDIIHGDFKATNVLVSDAGDALICDFGLSQLKSDLDRRSQEDPEAIRSVSGTLRWCSPERLNGKPLSNACDVYAFAITVCELYGVTEGEATPFGYVDDAIVKEKILDGHRPNKPAKIPKGLWAIVQRCWAQDPADRPTFETVVQDLAKVLAKDEARHPSTYIESPSTSSGSFETAPETLEPEEQHAISPQLAERLLPLDDDGNSSSSGSIRSIPPHLAKEISFESDRAERHYRHYLTHQFDDRLTIPLWFPADIPLGSVGYIRHGQFVKLLDATRPPLDVSEPPPIMRLDEFDSLRTSKSAVNVQNVADKGWEMVHTAWMNFVKSSGEKSQRAISKQYTFPLKPGGKQAILLVDDAEFEIYKSFSEARAYLVSNIDWILKYYSDSHHISKEDVIIVVGTLAARNYAMAVSNFAPKTTLMFNVHADSQRKAGEPWGTWAVNRQREADEPDLQYICKVSKVCASPRDTVLLAKLKFPPRGQEPALYP